jgi:hypothetical protein
MSSTTPPTLEQLLNLIDRAERKGLNAAEGDRLRVGLRFLAEDYPGDPGDVVSIDTVDLAELRRKYDNARKLAWRWRRRALVLAKSPTPEPAPPATPDPAPDVPAAPPATTDDRDALRRVTALAQRWMHIPAKRAAAASILSTITNRDADD